MLFNSLSFFIFFPVVTILYFMLPHKYRWLHLLLASCIFYAAFIPSYILILFFTIIVDYLAGIFIEKQIGRRRKIYLVVSIIVNVAFLAIFKYYNFFIENVNDLLHQANIEVHDLPFLNIILPIGLSFHTFQSMSYTIEVYRGKQKAEKHFGIYALYVMYYPQLVAGPIERPQNMIHQFKEEKYFEYNRVVDGLKLMAWGMFKKVVIADTLATLVNQFYAVPQNYSGLSALFAAICFSFQIYCDFSGYSDIAIGSSKVMGIDLMKNFNQPYLANSVADFWKRWHISLSTWFRDYLYIPLGGNRKGFLRTCLNVFIVFLVSGFWHGANWTFIVWGGLHGLYLVTSMLMNRKAKPQPLRSATATMLRNTGSIIFTFLLVTISWVFFRANSVGQGWDVIKIIFGGASVPSGIKETLIAYDVKPYYFIYLASIIALLMYVDYRQEKTDIVQIVNRKPAAVRWAFYFSVISAIVFLGIWGNQQFIYFQF